MLNPNTLAIRSTFEAVHSVDVLDNVITIRASVVGSNKSPKDGAGRVVSSVVAVDGSNGFMEDAHELSIVNFDVEKS